MAETVDQQVGLTYAEPTAAGLACAIADWESTGGHFDPIEARRRAEALSLGVFRQKMIALITEVAGQGVGHAVPPGPHWNSQQRLF